MEKKLFSFFGQRILEARDALSSLLRSVFRASSLIENVNGRLRPFMDLKREVPEPLFNPAESLFQHEERPPSKKPGLERNQRPRQIYRTVLPGVP